MKHLYLKDAPIFVIVIIASGLLLYINQDLLFSLTEQWSNSDGTATEITEQVVEEEKPAAPEKPSKKPEVSKNAAADGLSRFYANVRGDD